MRSGRFPRSRLETLGCPRIRDSLEPDIGAIGGVDFAFLSSGTIYAGTLPLTLLVVANGLKVWYHGSMMVATVEAGERYTAGRNGCTKFPLPVQVLCLNPVKPWVTVQDIVGVRSVRLSTMVHCIAHGCIALVPCKDRATASYKFGACNAARTVVSCSHAGLHNADTQTALRGTLEITKMANETNGNGVQVLTFYKNHKGIYSSFRLAGNRGSVNITNKLFIDGVIPQTIQVSGLVPEGTGDVPADVDKAAAAAAKAQEKADKAQEKAKVRAEKAQAIADKAKAAAEAALARAAAAQAKAAGAAGATAGTEVAGEQAAEGGM